MQHADASMSTSSFAEVAMLCQGDEVYGIGTIQKIYAQYAPAMLFVCMVDGPMYQWLKARGSRVRLFSGLAGVVAGSSASTLLRLPKILLKARRHAKELAQELRKESIRIVHTHWLPQQLMGIWLRSEGLAVAWQINNLTSRTRLMGFGLKMNHMFARRGADILLPASDFIADFWRDCQVPIRVVRNCASPLYAAPNHLPPTPLRCVIAGRLEAQKGHHLAIAAVAEARRQGFDVELDIFGGPLDNNAYADSLREQIRQSGCGEMIRLKGFVEDLRERHQSYHLGLQCRIDPEPCSLWVCETLVDGLPLVAAANGGTPELVLDGRTGVLFRTDDLTDFTQKLLSLVAKPDQMEQMRSAAFERGQRFFLPERFIRETQHAYQMGLDQAAQY